MTDTSETVENDYHGEEISEKVITAVAEAKNVDPLELEPLYNVIDPDALNSIFCSVNEPSSADIELQFSMAGCTVHIQPNGEVTVISPTNTDEEVPVASLDD